MKFDVDAGKIKRWREERHWSQEHLAELAGVGVRTVQRIETDEKASGDSLKALAAAFNVDVMALTVDAKREAEVMLREKNAKVTAAMRLGFFIHLASYLFGMVVFAGISLSIGGERYAMLTPTIWWTVGLAGHALALALVELTARYQQQVGAAD
jgi:transcriptional regulator with XRE-family HTH domain